MASTPSNFVMPGRPVTRSATSPGIWSRRDRYAAPIARGSLSNSGPMYLPANTVNSQVSSICHFAPSEQHPSALVETPYWQKDLDDHFMNVFQEPVLSQCPIDTVVARTLQIIGSPSQATMRGLALAVCTHWMRLQFRCKNAKAHASRVVALISRIADHLGRMSVHAQKDFFDELNHLCVKRLKLTWRWYASIVRRGAVPILRKNLFMRVMTVVAMMSYLFHGGILRFGAALDGLGYIAVMFPWPDAVAVIYAILHELGPTFALDQTAWHFIKCLLAELFPLAVGRVHSDPLCHLTFAINSLVTEWHRRTRVTLYYTYPKGNN